MPRQRAFMRGNGAATAAISCAAEFVAALLQRPAQRVVDARRGVLLHARQHVRIQIERDADAGMAEPFAGDFRMHAGGEQMRGVAVPQIVQPNARQRHGRPRQPPRLGSGCAAASVRRPRAYRRTCRPIAGCRAATALRLGAAGARAIPRSRSRREPPTGRGPTSAASSARQPLFAPRSRPQHSAAPARSTWRQRSAQISPRRSPQRTPSMTGTNRRLPRNVSNSSAVCAMS